MDDNLSKCLKRVTNNLYDFKDMHTVGRKAYETELDLIKEASSDLSDASEIVQDLDTIRVKGRKKHNVYLELQKQSEELRKSSRLMEEYETRESGKLEMPTAYDNVTYTIEWIEDFL